ncbi:Membrane protein [Sulfitobacter noctilucae]|uniref:CopD family protein n=1 Tax=Sulfitobacter noctilucae TaxID=1342302 RepID=UPI000468CCD9|nr:CopD family protein [Sulfitobacter noctilucae]KIN65748.1 Membrane protein [Sulfitobacter noctilucae]
MMDFLAVAYPWIKSVHIMAVISWMAALFYLPRLLVHHTERVGLEGETHTLFTMMEYKLAKVIMQPAMIVTWICGIALVLTPGIVDWSNVWPWTKFVGVLGMTAFHEWLMARMRGFQVGQNTLTGRQYRMMNEVPTLLMILIVLSVVVKF